MHNKTDKLKDVQRRGEQNSRKVFIKKLFCGSLLQKLHVVIL